MNFQQTKKKKMQFVLVAIRFSHLGKVKLLPCPKVILSVYFWHNCRPSLLWDNDER